MKWFFPCTACNEWHSFDWKDHGVESVCPTTKHIIIIPTPAIQLDGYVDTQEWPSEMEKVVVNLKGLMCTIPWCIKGYQTLDHRVPFSAGGRTSVDNLYPMCNEHNQSKGDADYHEWIVSISK